MKFLFALSLLLLAASNLWAEQYPLAVFPPGSEIVKTADREFINGMPLVVRHFRVEESLARIKLWYEKKWREEIVETSFDSWLQLGRFFEDVMYTVQLREINGWVEGRLLVSDMTIPPPPALQLPEGSTLITDSAHSDKHTEGRMVVIAAPQGPDYLVRWYSESYARKGYELLTRQLEQSSGARILRYGVGRSNATVIIMQSGGGGSQVMVTETRGVTL